MTSATGRYWRCFRFQAGHAIVWRDAICNWFARISGIADTAGRVGHHPNRMEAETMQMIGYKPVDVTPWEAASDGKAVRCEDAAGCTLSTFTKKAAGTYDIAVQYYDTWRGVSKYDLQVNRNSVAHWQADDTLPPAQFNPNLDGQDATRYVAHGIALKPGDVLVLKATPDLRPELQVNANAVEANSRPGARDYREITVVDYIEIGPDGPLTPQ